MLHVARIMFPGLSNRAV